MAQMGPANVAQLLEENRQDIQTIMERIKGEDSGGTCIVDELFVLRFVLADRENAEANIRATLQWRRNNRDILLRARSGDVPYENEMLRHVKRGACGWLAPHLLVMVVRAGHGDAVNLMRELTVEQVTQNLVMQYEHRFAILDERTRAKGVLGKLIFVLDLQNFSMRNFDRRFAKANGESGRLSNLYYPQLIQSIVIINLPSTFRLLYSLSERFSARAASEKEKICPARTKRGSAKDCPFLAQFGSENVENAIPRFLGGSCPTPRSLQLENEMDET